jgi:hypothetical protein
LLRAPAFRPFTAYAQGKTFAIRHPEFAVLNGRGRTLILLRNHDHAFDLFT